MGSARTSSSQANKQQSISSFFTPKPATQKPKVKDIPSQRPPPSTATPPIVTAPEDDDTLSVSNGEPAEVRRASTSSKRPAEDDDVTLSASKRRRTSSNAAKSAEPATLGIRREDSAKRTRVTERTSKYAFGNSTEASTAQAGDEEGDDEETRQLKARLHQKFVKKLGRPDSIANIRRRSGIIDEETQAGEDDGQDDEDEEEAPAPKKGGRKIPASRKGKLTPLDQKVVDLKRKHPDVLLVVEVGYKYRLYGEDARVAAKILSVVCIPGKMRFDEHPSEAHMTRFAGASFPTHRLHVHVKRLINAGHKVGIVRQLETAALKAAGANKSKLFERDLTNLYTKATYIDDEEGLGTTLAGAEGGAPASGHLLCLTESYPKGVGSDEKVQIGLIAVQPATGEIVYDDFEDGWMRSELETRLLHISPAEFVIVGEVSKATKKLVQHLSGGDDARLEWKDKPKTMAAQAYSHITKFYADKMKEGQPSSSQVQSSQDTGTLLDKVHRLSENATICLSAMITHLTDYGLQHVFDLTRSFQSFSARSHMLLNGNTLTSLEIYRNQTDQAEKGSLFWTLNHTQTRFGQRLLRKWVGRPLLDPARLNERVAAVEELNEGAGQVSVERIKKLLNKTRADLERTLIRIYYRKCARSELLQFLQTLQAVAQEYHFVNHPQDAGFQSSLINDAIASLPQISTDVLDYLGRMNLQAAKENDKYNFFRDEHETEDITDHKCGIVAVEHDLNEFKQTASALLKRKVPISYVTVAEIDYLVELDNTQLKNVPATWTKISSTKKVSRFHPPEVVKLIRERDQHKESLSNACDTAFNALLTEIGAKYQAFRECIQSLALLDCLTSLASVAQQPGYCKPTFTDKPGISIEAGRHPMVEQLLLENFVPNSIDLSGDATRALLITGPNMGGKSSYVRSVALIAIMAQTGSYVPADACELGLLDAVFTRMGAFDNMMKGESTFMVELGETSDILKQATPRSLVILDELGRGTSTHDGVAIAQSVLQHMVSVQKSLTLFITHYQSLAKVAETMSVEGGETNPLRNVHMQFTENENTSESGDKDITFLYEVGEGVAHRSYGLNVARLAGLPKSLLDEAARRSKAMEEEEGRRRVTYLAKTLSRVIAGGQGTALERLTNGVEQL
ncbi:Putative DNA mismatch repair protein MutS, core [Septoria linicola]|uniref:MutS protein homolog 3 n=1 Tax=Septoria linicola TaxID=215465 RepID=A0A9Q9B7V5_9PEZI|nr:Putative DNA mismatch repair protein MutS, core [Septoria linicola]